MKAHHFIVLFVLSCFPAFSQNKGSITASVNNERSVPARDALVTLYKASDSILVKTVFTDSTGSFTFDRLPFTDYYFTIGYGGYQSYRSSGITVSESNAEVKVGKVTINPKEASSMQEVTVIGAVPFVQKKVDRTVVTPDALLSAAGLNVLDVLGKSPGVRVDVDGIISLLGKNGVVVFIDNKPTHLSASDLANYLRSLPALAVQSFEIMTVPPARYDASGNAGIINIKMKKMTTKGFNGSINLGYGQGIYPRSNSGLVFNYRINKFNFFSNVSYSLNNIFQDLVVNRRYYQPNGTLNTIFNQHTTIKRELFGLNYKAGVDYYVNSKSTLGFVFNGFNNRDTRGADNQARISDDHEQLLSTVLTENPTKRSFNNVSANLNYNYKFDNKGKELAVNTDVLHYKSKLTQSLLSNTYKADGTFANAENLQSELPADILIRTLNLDYTHPVKDGSVEAGAKASNVTTDNVASFYDDVNGVLRVNNTFTNSFAYKENIYALYASGSKTFNRFTMQLGMRYERTDITGRQYGNVTQKDSVFEREFNNLFPTIYGMYKLDSMGNHSLSFSYGRRINRPDYQSMNPFTYPVDRFTLYSGNPFLQPTFSNNFELSYNYKGILNTALLYSYVSNTISEVVSQGTNTFLSRPGNIGEQISYGVSVDFGKPMNKWWMLQIHTEVMHNISRAQLIAQALDNRGTYWFIGPVSQFQLPKKWSIELSGSYQTKMASAQFVMVPLGSFNMAVSKKIAKDKLTFKLAANDIFYTNKPGGEITSLGNSGANWRSRLDSRVVTFSINYRFNKGQNLKTRKVGAADTEKSRVK